MSGCTIYDDKSGICILSQRVFDNVRFDLLQEPLTFTADIPYSPEAVSALLATGASSCTVATTLTVTGVDSDGYATVCGTLLLGGTVQYTYEGTAYASAGRLQVPFSARLHWPEEGAVPLEFLLQYSFTASDFVFSSGTDWAVSATGSVIVLLTAKVPVCVPYLGPLIPNSMSQRNASAADPSLWDFYPSAPAEPRQNLCSLQS